MSKKILVWVVAWQYDGGAGFDFYWNKEDADAAYLDELNNVKELANEGWSAYFFPFEYEPAECDDENDREAMKEEIITEIDKDIDKLCQHADVKEENVLSECGNKLSELRRA